MALNQYMQDVQRYLKDERQERYNPYDLVRYINEARQTISRRGQCIRVLPLSGGTIIALTIVNQGNGQYVSPQISISAPESPGGIQATATISVSGISFSGSGPITFSGSGPISFETLAVMLTNGGTGYLNPIITVTDAGGSGSGAVVTATLSSSNATVVGQEVYNFSALTPALRATAQGVDSVHAVISIAASWGSWKPLLRYMDWSGFQAYLRSANIGQTNYPEVWSQYGQGQGGSVFVWPIPSVVTPWDWDCLCVPFNLQSDADFEAIPYPWTSAVSFYATYLALLGEARGDRRDDARFFYAEFDRRMREARADTTPPRVPDIYDVY
jgi:hypothetical protein